MQNELYDVQAQLIDAINAHDELTVKRLLNQGASPNESLDSANVTPLHYAAQHNATFIIRALLSAGADRYSQTYPDGQTPYDIAQINQHAEAMAMLKGQSQNTNFN